MGWILEFNGLPLSPNDRGEWKKINDRKRWRRITALAAREAEIPYLERAKVSFVIHRPRVGKADEDNDRARFKPVIDGLVDASVLPGDRRHQIVYGSCKETRGTLGFDLVLDPIGERCSRCGDDTEEVKDWVSGFWLCFQCFADMATAFLGQKDYDSIREWIGGKDKGTSEVGRGDRASSRRISGTL